MNSKPFLPKRLGWIALAALLFLDAFLDVIRGAEGNPLWKPAVAIIGIEAVPFLVPLILPLFYIAVKAAGWLIKRVDRLPHAEELVLTSLVLVFAVYDIWVMSVDFLGFRLITSHYQIIPVLIVAALAYALSAECLIRRKRK